MAKAPATRPITWPISCSWCERTTDVVGPGWCLPDGWRQFSGFGEGLNSIRAVKEVRSCCPDCYEQEIPHE